MASENDDGQNNNNNNVNVNDDQNNNGDNNNTNNRKHRRKLRALVITMGYERQKLIEELFNQPNMIATFDPPQFSHGIPQRQLRNRYEFLRIANDVGIIPSIEWDAIRTEHEEQRKQQQQQQQQHKQNNSNTNSSSSPSSSSVVAVQKKKIVSEKFFDCLDNVPIPNPLERKGNEIDRSLHYSVELWRKAKNINRGRSVLACTFAHLIAIKRCVNENFDLILEDNVRSCPDDCAKRIWECIHASKEWENENENEDNDNEAQLQKEQVSSLSEEEAEQSQRQKQQRCSSCHFRFHGWLGSVTNIEWLLKKHNIKRGYKRRQSCNKNNEDNDDDNQESSNNMSVFPFPLPTDLEEEEEEGTEVDEEQEEQPKEDSPNDNDNEENNNNHNESIATKKRKPGGNFVWGCYCYWISKTAYKSMMETLRNDVGSILWKGKRQRYYQVKPIDKILPRHVAKTYGRSSVHVATHPSFFRAPMLTSKIHIKYDRDFCISTEYQLMETGYCKSNDGDNDNDKDNDSGFGPWSKIWLSENEKKIVQHHEKYGKWLTNAELEALSEED